MNVGPTNEIQAVRSNQRKDIKVGISNPNSIAGYLMPTPYPVAHNKIVQRSHCKTLRSANHVVNSSGSHT